MSSPFFAGFPHSASVGASLFDEMMDGPGVQTTTFTTNDGTGTVHITKTVIGDDGSVRREMRFRTPGASGASPSASSPNSASAHQTTQGPKKTSFTVPNSSSASRSPPRRRHHQPAQQPTSPASPRSTTSSRPRSQSAASRTTNAAASTSTPHRNGADASSGATANGGFFIGEGGLASPSPASPRREKSATPTVSGGRTTATGAPWTRSQPEGASTPNSTSTPRRKMNGSTLSGSTPGYQQPTVSSVRYLHRVAELLRQSYIILKKGC
jgi:hypothetical protein